MLRPAIAPTAEEPSVTLRRGASLRSAMWVGVTLYALFAGADFGAGFWDLVAGGAGAGAAQRRLIEERSARCGRPTTSG